MLSFAAEIFGVGRRWLFLEHPSTDDRLGFETVEGCSSGAARESFGHAYGCGVVKQPAPHRLVNVLTPKTLYEDAHLSVYSSLREGFLASVGKPLAVVFAAATG